MTKPTIGSTTFGYMLGINAKAVDATAFLIKNPEVVMREKGLEILKNLRIHTRTPMTDIFIHLVEAEKLPMFTITDMTISRESIPELFTLNDITVDGKYLNASIPKTYQNAWINLTPILSKRDAYNSAGGFSIADIPTMAALFARGALCMSYNDNASQGWLSPVLNTFIVESYVSMIVPYIAQYYKLEYDERKLVETIFATYYAQLLQPEEMDPMSPPLLMRCGFLGSPAEIKLRLSVFEETRELNNMQRLSIGSCCKLLTMVGPSRMKDFTADKVYIPLTRSAVDSQAMSIALDYPPYWVYQLMTNVYGSKNPMLNNLIRYNEMKGKIMKFTMELNASKLFVERIKR